MNCRKKIMPSRAGRRNHEKAQSKRGVARALATEQPQRGDGFFVKDCARRRVRERNRRKAAALSAKLEQGSAADGIFSQKNAGAKRTLRRREQRNKCSGAFSLTI